MTDPFTDPEPPDAEELAAHAQATLEHADLALSQLEFPDHATTYEALQRIDAQRQQGIGQMLIAIAALLVEQQESLDRLVELGVDADRRIRNETRSDETLTEAIYPAPDMAPDAGIFIDVRDGGLAITQTLDFAVPIAVNGEWLPGTPRKRYVVNLGGDHRRVLIVERARRNAADELRRIADLVEQGALL